MSHAADADPDDIIEDGGDHQVPVWEDYAKRDTYREVPIPAELANIANTLAYDMDPDESLVDAVGSTVYRWVRRAAERRQAATNDSGWSFIDVHDPRWRVADVHA